MYMSTQTDIHIYAYLYQKAEKYPVQCTQIPMHTHTSARSSLMCPHMSPQIVSALYSARAQANDSDASKQTDLENKLRINPELFSQVEDRVPLIQGSRLHASPQNQHASPQLHRANIPDRAAAFLQGNPLYTWAQTYAQGSCLSSTQLSLCAMVQTECSNTCTSVYIFVNQSTTSMHV
jgi:hypothetical protein